MNLITIKKNNLTKSHKRSKIKKDFDLRKNCSQIEGDTLSFEAFYPF